MDGDFDEPVAEGVGAVVAHEAGVVEEVAVAEKGQGMLAEFPGWGAVASESGAGEGPEDGGGFVEDGGFFIRGEGGRRLVEVAVMADFVAGVRDTADEGGMAFCDPAGDVEGGGDVMRGEQVED